jgi:pyridoxine 5-phosphate synthase
VKTNLSVNLNKVALLRNQRPSGYPDVLAIASVVIDAGADGLTVHPRPDGRHIRYSDVRDLHDLVARDVVRSVEFNVEGYPSQEFLDLVLSVRPTQVTLVPDESDQLTSDHGWDLDEEAGRLEPIVARLAAAGIRVSLFVEPNRRVIPTVKDVGAHRIELFTGPYARAFEAEAYADVLAEYRFAAESAIEVGLAINAGHDLTLRNLPLFKASIPMLAEVSIGQAITADALRLGFPQAVRAYLSAVA